MRFHMSYFIKNIFIPLFIPMSIQMCSYTVIPRSIFYITCVDNIKILLISIEARAEYCSECVNCMT